MVWRNLGYPETHMQCNRHTQYTLVQHCTVHIILQCIRTVTQGKGAYVCALSMYIFACSDNYACYDDSSVMTSLCSVIQTVTQGKGACCVPLSASVVVHCAFMCQVIKLFSNWCWEMIIARLFVWSRCVVNLFYSCIVQSYSLLAYLCVKCVGVFSFWMRLAWTLFLASNCFSMFDTVYFSFLHVSVHHYLHLLVLSHFCNQGSHRLGFSWFKDCSRTRLSLFKDLPVVLGARFVISFGQSASDQMVIFLRVASRERTIFF